MNIKRNNNIPLWLKLFSQAILSWFIITIVISIARLGDKGNGDVLLIGKFNALYFFAVSAVVSLVIIIFVYVIFYIKLKSEYNLLSLPTNAIGLSIYTARMPKYSRYNFNKSIDDIPPLSLLGGVLLFSLMAVVFFAIWNLISGIHGILWKPVDISFQSFWNGVVLFRLGTFTLFLGILIFLKPFFQLKKGSHPKYPGKLRTLIFIIMMLIGIVVFTYGIHLQFTYAPNHQIQVKLMGKK